MSARIFTVVLTGGIASGKTAVSDRFAELGAAVIDTDLIARQVVQPGQPALGKIAERLGDRFIDGQGALDRRRLREAIFADPKLKQRLEAILHPPIAREALRQVTAAKAPYALLVIPLYTESGRYAWIDRVLVVDVPESVQIERVMARDRISRDQAGAILDAQAAREERLALADDVIENSGSIEELHLQVGKLHSKYLGLAASV